MLSGPPHIHCLPRTLAYPGLNLGKWSDIGTGTQAHDSDLLY